MTHHAGPPAVKPAGYRGRHAAPRCPIIALVSIPDSDRVTFLACDWTAGHPGDNHYDEQENIQWQSPAARTGCTH